MSLSTKLTSLAAALETLTGHGWAVYEDFTPLVAGIRQGRIFPSFVSVPDGFANPIGTYEVRQLVTISVHTRLKFTTGTNILLEAVDYPMALFDHINIAAEQAGVEVLAANGDRHAALEVSLRPQIDTDPKLIGDCNTAAVWSLWHNEPSSRP